MPSAPEPEREPAAHELTRALAAASAGDSGAATALLELVYQELHAMAQRRMRGAEPGQTLQATSLVHEAWLKLAGERVPEFESRVHFFGAAARAMRNILVDAARKRHAERNGGGQQRVDLSTEFSPGNGSAPAPEDTLAVDEALTALERRDPRKARIVELKVFSGMTMEEVAQALGVSLSTAEREWRFARAWLAQAIEGRQREDRPRDP